MVRSERIAPVPIVVDDRNDLARRNDPNFVENSPQSSQKNPHREKFLSQKRRTRAPNVENDCQIDHSGVSSIDFELQES